MYRPRLLVSTRDKILDLFPDGVPRPRLLRPPRGGHHAVGAALVAAIDDVDPGADGRGALRLGGVLHDVGGRGRHNLESVEGGGASRCS